MNKKYNWRHLFSIVILIMLLSIVFQSFSIKAESEEENDLYSYMVVSGTTRGDVHVEYLYSDSMLLIDARQDDLSTDIAKASVCLAGAGYEIQYINPMLESMGFDVMENYLFTDRTIDDNDHVAFTIGHKVINGMDAYCVVIKGTSGDEEWFSNFNLGKNNHGRHEGFFAAAKDVMDVLEPLIKRNGIYWITGHSRGAAVANIVASYCTDRVGGEHVFGYTYACPAVYKYTDEIGVYNNIHNFNNTGDVVARIPLKEWGYKRFGIDHSWDYGSAVRERGGSYNGGYDAESLILAIQQFINDEADFYDPLAIFAMNCLAFKMQDNSHTSKVQFFAKYGKIAFDEFLLRKIETCNDIFEMISSMNQTYDDLEESRTLLSQIENETSGFSDEQFSVYLTEHEETILKISKKTGILITLLTDIPVVGEVLKLAPTAWKAGRALPFFSDFYSQTDGEVKKGIKDAHEVATYVYGISHKYFGYRGYSGSSSTTVLIPENITTLGPETFFMNESISELEIPETVKFVGSKTLMGCTSINNLMISDGVIGLGQYCFAGMSGLTELIMPVEFVMREDLFEYVESQGMWGGYHYYSTDHVEVLHLTNGTTGIMPDSVKNANTIAAVSRSSLREVILDEGIQNIGAYAFYNSSDFSSLDGDFEITIPCTVTRIGEYAFSGGHKWKDGKVVIPDTVTEIGSYCYSGSDIIEVQISSGMSEIPVGAFSGSKVLKQVDIPETIEVIDQMAFLGCVAIEQLTIPDNVVELGESCLAGLNSLKELAIPVEFMATQNLFYYRHNVILETKDIETLRVTCGRTGIMPDDYEDDLRAPMMKLIGPDTVVILEEGIQNIGAYIFYSPTSPRIRPSYQEQCEIRIPSTVTRIGEYAFAGNHYWKDNKVIIPDTVTEIGDYCFYNSDMAEVQISSGMTEIPTGAFSGCTLLERVDIPDAIRVIGPKAFLGCTAIEELVIPDEVIELGASSLAVLDNLRDLTMSVELMSVDTAFSYYNGYKTVGTCGVETLHLTRGTTGIMPDTSSYDSKTIAHLSGNCLMTVILDEGIMNIGAYAFSVYGESFNCFDIIFPSTVEKIGQYAFSGLRDWKDGKVTIPATVTEIGVGCYMNNRMEELLIFSGITEIPQNAFYGCTSLTNAKIPCTIESIGAGAFSGCESLRYIWFEGTENQWLMLDKASDWARGTHPDLVVHYNSCLDCHYITFDGNGGDGMMYNDYVVVEDGMDCCLPECDFIYPGYHFMYWRDIDGNLYFDQDEIECVLKDMVLFAEWDINTETVYMDSYDHVNNNTHAGGKILFSIISRLDDLIIAEDSGEVSQNMMQMMLYGVNEIHLIAVPDEGYEFIGWFKGSVMDNTEELKPESELISSGTECIVYIDGDNFTYPVCAVFGKERVLNLPASLVEIEKEAFEGISATVVYVPDNCRHIGERAFMNTSIYKVHIPGDCELADNVFYGCRLVYLISSEGSFAQHYCESYSNCLFVIEEE